MGELKMKSDILLTSSDFIKSATNCSDNLNEKVMQTAIREAQEIDLKEIVGDHMLKRLKQLVETNMIREKRYKFYKKLLDEAQYFLAYAVLTKLCMITTFKIDNVGIVKTSDDRIETLSIDDVYAVQNYYQKKADYFQGVLQNYILNNRDKLKEIDCNRCNDIHAHLYSAASGGLWLGGRRGKGFNGCCYK